MNNESSEKRAICFVFENIRPYKKFFEPELNRRFDVTSQELEFEYEAGTRFDKSNRIWMEVSNFIKLFSRISFYSRHDATVCFARKRHLSFLVFARIMKLFGVRIKLYLFGFYIQSWAFSKVKKYLISKLFTENVGILVISKSDQDFLKELSPKADIRYYPYCQVPRKDVDNVVLGDYVFAGGHTNRDYDTVLKCAQEMPEIKFILVWSQYTRVKVDKPANVKVYVNIEGKEFYDLLAKSRLVVIPLLRKGHSAGQTVALAAMQYAKTVIYSNFENVSQYFDEGVTGIEYVSGDALSLSKCIKGVVGNEDKLLEIGKLAQEKYYKYYTREKLDKALLTHIDEFSKEVVD